MLLDGITDTRNFGAILRSAAASGVDALFVSTSASAPLNGDVVKTSAGGAFKVPISKVLHLKDVVYHLKAHNIKIFGITEKQIEMKSVDITVVFLNFLEDRINLFFKLIEIANAKCFPF